MYRIRFHGRGGQGMKTASRILGKALFLEGFEVQDAPRYGAERRGAPIFAYVRASGHPINERGIIRNPDLVIVADESLMAIPAAGILEGCASHTVLLIQSNEKASLWKERLNFQGQILTLPDDQETPSEAHFIGAICAGASAMLLGIIRKNTLKKAIAEELETLSISVRQTNQNIAVKAFDRFKARKGIVQEGPPVAVKNFLAHSWINLPCENAVLAAPAIHTPATTENIPTGLWRTMRPVIDYQRCNRCWWLCSTFCPEGAIHIDEKRSPQIDYKHCKGCMICLSQCPTHAVSSVVESAREQGETGGANK